LLARGVGSIENPVLPCRQTTENTGFHAFNAIETQVGLKAGKRIGRQSAALFEGDADLVVPVEAVERVSNQAQLFGLGCVDTLADRGRHGADGRLFFVEAASDTT